MLCMSPKTIEHIIWYHSHDAMDEVIMHPSNDKTWKQFNSVHS